MTIRQLRNSLRCAPRRSYGVLGPACVDPVAVQAAGLRVLVRGAGYRGRRVTSYERRGTINDRCRTLVGHTRDEPDGPLRRDCGHCTSARQQALTARSGHIIRSLISGHPLTGLCQGAIPFRRDPSFASIHQAQLPAARLPADSNRIRFLALLAANRIAPVTHQVQACRDVLRPPWRLLPPQRNVGAKPCPKGWSHSCGCRDGDASPQLAHGLGDSVICTPIGWHKDGVQSFEVVVHQTAFLAHRLWPSHYTKQRCTSKGFCSRSMW